MTNEQVAAPLAAELMQLVTGAPMSAGTRNKLQAIALRVAAVEREHTKLAQIGGAALRELHASAAEPTTEPECKWVWRDGEWVNDCRKCGPRPQSLLNRSSPPCWCHKCNPQENIIATRMILCPDCGNKRCPKASDHTLACTNSNAPGQPGSVYA